MIIFGSILTTFELSIIFGGSWGSIENWLKPKAEPLSGNLSCPNPWNALYLPNLLNQLPIAEGIFNEPCDEVRNDYL